MNVDNLLKMASERPITLSESEIAKRKQLIIDVFIESGHGILNGRVISAVNLFSTRQLTLEEAQEFIRGFDGGGHTLSE